jgi:hypothetical protein
MISGGNVVYKKHIFWEMDQESRNCDLILLHMLAKMPQIKEN